MPARLDQTGHLTDTIVAQNPMRRFAFWAAKATAATAVPAARRGPRPRHRGRCLDHPVEMLTAPLQGWRDTRVAMRFWTSETESRIGHGGMPAVVPRGHGGLRALRWAGSP